MCEESGAERKRKELRERFFVDLELGENFEIIEGKQFPSLKLSQRVCLSVIKYAKILN